MSDEPLSLEERVRRIEDRQALADLVARYCSALDDRDLDAFVSVYARSGVLRHADDSFRLQGQDAIREYYAQRFKQYGVTFHYPHTQVIQSLEKDSASGEVRAHAEMVLDGVAYLAAFRYSDQYIRESDGWKFLERVLACWYYLPLEELSSGLTGELRKYYKGERRAAELPESLPTYRLLHGLD